MCLEILGYCFHSLPYAVAYDKKEEASAPEVGGERIVEALLVNGRINSPHHIKQRVAVVLKTIVHLALKIR
jgi:hypothetical protein